MRPVLPLLLVACASGSSGTPDASPVADPDAAVPDAMTPDAAPGCTDMTVNLLVDGDFETPNGDWTEVTNGALPIVREQGNGLPFNPNDGVRAAILGGFNNGVLELSQAVAVPADHTLTRLTAFRCWVTNEGAGTFDTARLEVRDNTGAAIATLLDLDNEDAEATCDWEPLEVPLDALVGLASFTLHFSAATDAATATTFAFDTIAVEASACL